MHDKLRIEQAAYTRLVILARSTGCSCCARRGVERDLCLYIQYTVSVIISFTHTGSVGTSLVVRSLSSSVIKIINKN